MLTGSRSAYSKAAGPMASTACGDKSARQLDVRFGSLADIDPLPSHVRFVPKSGQFKKVSVAWQLGRLACELILPVLPYTPTKSAYPRWS